MQSMSVLNKNVQNKYLSVIYELFEEVHVFLTHSKSLEIKKDVCVRADY